MNCIEAYGRKYNTDNPVDAVELIFDVNYGLDNDIENIIRQTGGRIEHVWNRAKELGWEYTGEAHSCANDIIELIVLDPAKRKHWLQFNTSGEAWFDAQKGAWYLFGWTSGR